MKSRRRVSVGRPRFVVTCLALAAAGLRSFPTQADEIPPTPWLDSVAIYAGQGIDHNLFELPGTILRGDIEWERSYFTGIGLGGSFGSLGEDIPLLAENPIGRIRHGYEAVVVKHRGLQDNLEAGAAYILRTPELHVGWLGVNFAAGAGLSYAFGETTYEDGSKDNPEERYRLQLLGLFEFEWLVRGMDELSIVTRVHHRSGGYGLIAPSGVGSNFLAAGVRWHF